MKLNIRGKNSVEISTHRDFLASGGQGDVFEKGGIAYKIYKDVSKMIPVAKIDELSVLTEPNIIRPQDVILGKKNNPIGYTMIYVKDSVSMCQIFTKAFKTRHSISQDAIIQIVKKLHTGVSHIHSKQILIVDLNELNVLVNNKFDNVYFIDVDSYQTRSFPADAIMPNIRDYHATKWTELTDWFSWGIVTFQLFMGIHPYKGSYNGVKTKNIEQLRKRMEQNISLFNTGVSFNSQCPPINSIPQAYRDWYNAVFEKGQRIPPPFDAQAVIIIPTVVKIISGGDNFNISLFKALPSDVITYFYENGVEAVLTDSGMDVYNKYDKNVISTCQISLTPKTNHLVTATIELDSLKLYDTRLRKEIPVNLKAQNVMSYQGRLYIKNEMNISEIQFVELPNSIQVSPRIVANVMNRSTHMFDGVAIQDMLGNWYASIFPEHGKSFQIHLKELKGYKLVAAKFENNVLMVAGAKNGKYDRYVFRFSSSYDSYDMNLVEDVSFVGLNFIVLDNGICVHINEDEQLELFSNKKDSSDMKIIDDDVVSGDMKLLKKGTSVLFSKDNEIFTLRMK